MAFKQDLKKKMKGGTARAFELRYDCRIVHLCCLHLNTIKEAHFLLAIQLINAFPVLCVNDICSVHIVMPIMNVTMQPGISSFFWGNIICLAKR